MASISFYICGAKIACFRQDIFKSFAHLHFLHAVCELFYFFAVFFFVSYSANNFLSGAKDNLRDPIWNPLNFLDNILENDEDIFDNPLANPYTPNHSDDEGFRASKRSDILRVLDPQIFSRIQI